MDTDITSWYIDHAAIFAIVLVWFLYDRLKDGRPPNDKTRRLFEEPKNGAPDHGFSSSLHYKDPENHTSTETVIQRPTKTDTSARIRALSFQNNGYGQL